MKSPQKKIKEAVIAVRVTTEQLAILEKAANAKGLGTSTWLRTLGLTQAGGTNG